MIAYMDEKATKEQEAAILGVYTGKTGWPRRGSRQADRRGGPVERVPFTFDVHQGKGSLRIGSAVAADLEPFRGPAIDRRP